MPSAPSVALETTSPVDPSLPPRERILAAARDLFYRYGLHSVGVDAIAEAAGTNKMTLYRHFVSKDQLIAECMRQIAGEFELAGKEIERQHAGDPRAQLMALLRLVVDCKQAGGDRGCALANAAVQLPDADHPAKRVIEETKSRFRAKIIALCRDAGLLEPDLLADGLFLLCEGGRISIQSVGPAGPAAHLPLMIEKLIEAHEPALPT